MNPASRTYAVSIGPNLPNKFEPHPVASAQSPAKRETESKRRTSRLTPHESTPSITVYTGFVLATERPSPLVSYERAISDQNGLIDGIATFLEVDPQKDPLRSLILIKPGQYKAFDDLFVANRDS